MSHALINMHLQIDKLKQKKIVLFFQILIYYLSVYIIAIFTYKKLTMLNIVVETIAPKDSILNSLYIFGSILVFTIFLLILIKLFKKIPFFKIIELFFVFITLIVLFNLFLNIYISLGITVFIIILKEIIKNKLFNNLIITLMIGFIGGYIAYSLSILPIVVLLVLIGIYDYIAVFKTKHMVILAKHVVTKNSAMLYNLTLDGSFSKEYDKKLLNDLDNKTKVNVKSKFNEMKLGTGDIALPLIALTKFTFLNIYFGIICLIGLILVLTYTLTFLLNNKKHIKALPAMPLQSIFILFLYFVYLLIL